MILGTIAAHGGAVDPLVGINVGDSFRGGYYAGIIDTTKGNIVAADAFQTGARYALIVAPASLASSQSYKASNDAATTGSRTRWNGLGATAAQAADPAVYAAADYCAGLTYPTDDASAWYLPAMDELELIYRNLKPSTTSNAVGSDSSSAAFPGVNSHGNNPSSDPAGAAYTSGSPAQTSVTIFRSGGAQSLGTGFYWTATEYGTGHGWFHSFNEGYQSSGSKTSAYGVRPVRRLVL